MRMEWFKFYPSDFINSPDVVMMGPAARGCYITLLAHCWLNIKNGGGIPAKPEYILSICNCTDKEWVEVRDEVLSKFEKRDGQIFNKRLVAEMKEVNELSETKSENAQSGWETRRNASALLPHSIRNASAPNRIEGEVEENKNRTECSFKRISLAYRRAMGKSSGKDKRLQSQYETVCRVFGEEAVIAAFEEWAELNKWKSDKPALYFFFKDAPDLIEEKAEAAKPMSIGVESEIIIGRTTTQDLVEEREKEIEADKNVEPLPLDRF